MWSDADNIRVSMRMYFILNNLRARVVGLLRQADFDGMGGCRLDSGWEGPASQWGVDSGVAFFILD